MNNLQYVTYIGGDKVVMFVYEAGSSMGSDPGLLAIVVGENRDDCKRRWIAMRGGNVDNYEAAFEEEMRQHKFASFLDEDQISPHDRLRREG